MFCIIKQNKICKVTSNNRCVCTPQSLEILKLSIMSLKTKAPKGTFLKKVIDC